MHITGTHISYYLICKRKLWLFAHGIQMEHTSDTVRMGKQVSEDSYEREQKEFLIDNTISLDRVKDGVVHEVKKSNRAEFAHEAQLLYYLWILEQKGNKNLKGQLDYPLLRETKIVELTPENRQKVQEWIVEVEQEIAKDKPIPPINKKICKKCSYYEYCYS